MRPDRKIMGQCSLDGDRGARRCEGRLAEGFPVEQKEQVRRTRDNGIQLEVQGDRITGTHDEWCHQEGDR